MFTIDAHLDLSMNAMDWNRDLRKPVHEIRIREKGMTDKPDRGNNVVCFPELRKGNIGLVVATQIARYVAADNPLPGWNSPQQAWAQTQGQLEWYKEMELEGELVQINSITSLEEHIGKWMDGTSNDKKPIGYILSLEGADSIVTLAHLEKAYAKGLRALGPAHYGPGRYAQGTNATGGLGKDGKALLKEMERLNIILDATHLCDDSFWEAMENFSGHVWASHHNCRALVNHNRQFSDDQLKELIARGAVIGGVLDAWMMVPDWILHVSTPKEMNCNLERVVDHMDHICQLAGNALHIGIGSDLDGAFGKEQSPYDLETIADLQKIPKMLSNRGYRDQDIENVMHGNWLRFLRNAWQQ
ncbi:MAG: membrane dipeptidase [Cyclobacteriaceae bacterium]|nr:membrane dipeptidase [Cyclobacteriaceae bacterium]